MFDPALNVLDGVPGISFVPFTIEGLSHEAELDDEVGRQVFRADFAALLLPQADQGLLVPAHDDAGVGAADEVAPFR